MDPEAAFVRAFLPKEKWARYLQLLPNRHRRGEVLVSLNRTLEVLPGCAREVPEEEDFPEALEMMLLAHGAPPTCHVVASGLRLDGREVPLGEALHATCLHPFGSLLLCLPGRLALHRPQAPGRSVLLEKRF